MGAVMVATLFWFSCTDNDMAKNYGGTVKYEIPAGQKFVNATWKDADLWIITTDRTDSSLPRTYTMTEKSSYGVMEGKVVITEK